MTESSTQPNLANAQVTGGGGNEPDPEDRPVDAARPANTGSGVDLKTEDLPETEE